MIDIEEMYPEFNEARAGRQHWNAPLLIEIRTGRQPVRFAISRVNALRFAKWLAETAQEADYTED